jgi:raffinose/stachyose/melibiose transport system permease protein
MKSSSIKGNQWSLYLLVLPVLLLWLTFVFYPASTNFFYCFFDYNGLGADLKFKGLDNFVRAYTRDWYTFGPGFINSIKYSAVVAFVQNIFAVGLAILLTKKLKMTNIYRAIIFFPAVVGTMVIAMTWSLFLDTRGIFNSFLHFLNLPSTTPWLGHPLFSFWIISFIIIWTYTGYSMVIYIAGLQQIDGQYYEAATVDGVNAWQKLTKITLPLLMPSITINLLLSLAGTFKILDLPFLLGGGDFHAISRPTTTMSLNIYYEFQRMHFGYACAQQVILFFMVLTVAVFQTRFTMKREVAA